MKVNIQNIYSVFGAPPAVFGFFFQNFFLGAPAGFGLSVVVVAAVSTGGEAVATLRRSYPAAGG